MQKWQLEPIKDEFLGWRLVDRSISNNIDNTISFIRITNSLEKSVSDAALIVNAPELFDMCKKFLDMIDIEHPLYEKLVDLIFKAEGLEGDTEPLEYFDDIYEDHLTNKSIMHISLKDNKCSYQSDAKMSELFSYYDISDNTGIIMLNVSGDFTDYEEYSHLDLRCPIGHLVSLNTYNEYIDYMSKLYPNMKALMTTYENLDLDIAFNKFIYDDFINNFGKNYLREMSLQEYLNTYSLVTPDDGFCLTLLLPKHFEGCPNSIHLDISVTHNNNTETGIIIEKDNRYFVYNQQNKFTSLFIINNNEADKKAAKLQFHDFLLHDKVTK